MLTLTHFFLLTCLLSSAFGNVPDPCGTSDIPSCECFNKSVLFLLDSGGSRTPEVLLEFQSQKDLITTIVKALPSSVAKHLSLIQFGSKSRRRVTIPFGKAVSADWFIKKLDAARFFSGITSVGPTIQFAAEKGFARNKRTQKIVILVHDGKTWGDKPVESAELLRALSDLEFFVISALEKNDKSMLGRIAGNPNQLFLGPDAGQRLASTIFPPCTTDPPDSVPEPVETTTQKYRNSTETHNPCN